MFVERYVIFGVIVFFVSVKEGQSLSCFNCNSYDEKDCLLDVIPEKFKTECPDSTYTICRKIKQVIDFEVNGLKPNTRIIRMCGKQQEDQNNKKTRTSATNAQDSVDAK
ncbi:Sleepless protein [Popillia japonica]|uniref:Sleepless protein n=1 Tax=Popillia japonica TaxID=7064 RepID=A0AAW1L336_POPJA